MYYNEIWPSFKTLLHLIKTIILQLQLETCIKNTRSIS
jgi:hypothetical protein